MYFVDIQGAGVGVPGVTERLASLVSLMIPFMKSKFLSNKLQNEVTMRKFIPHNQWIFRFLFNTIFLLL